MGNSSSSSSSQAQQQPASGGGNAQDQGGSPYAPARVYSNQNVQSYSGGNYHTAYQYQRGAGATPGNYYGSMQFGGQAQPHQPLRPLVPQPTELTTQTLRNQVNLKKDTISVGQLEGRPDALGVSFHFDATASCRVSVFINARDGKDRNTLSYEGDVLAVAQYEQGINQAFPPAGGAPTAVPPGAMARWASMPPGLYALAIRLEALTDDGRAHGHSIDFVEAGGELPEWVQSQTTYVQLVRGDNGVWHASHVLQKLWINGSTFELQEIYGLEPSRGSASAAGGDAGLVDGVVEDDGGNECVICMSATRDTMSLPCRHMCMCHGCADELKTQTNKCPICRNVISSLLHIKIGKGQPGGASGAGAAAAAGPSA
uniref:RING-type E3 ubiquitin transferase n=1 Tax=Chlamydomonas euryale TaxID=1486919 RepID=A0A7R9VMS5_9CHLO|mmetsp:Transcript_4012/g.11460  ORF Transcript_4012/g.11460 Transcript_4012/m.11460 type:complete len:371 (+) Transcript_4012:327-1439(+)